jgi:serine/threonine protein kinase
MKLELLHGIASTLSKMHMNQLVHCDLHGGNVMLHKNSDTAKILGKSFICDLGLSRSTKSESNSDIRGVLPFIAPEVFSTLKFTQESDAYAFGIIMHLVATGEPPFRDRLFDLCLTREIRDGLRPTIPDSAPDEYKKLAEWCCDVDPNERPRSATIKYDIGDLIEEVEKDKSDNNIWNTIYQNDVQPLSRLEKESRYSSKLYQTSELDLAAGMKVTGLLFDV